MPIKRVVIPDIGPVTLAKRRGARNLRLSVTAKGEVRVSMPSWTPYGVGVTFAKARADWILKSLKDYHEIVLTDGMLIGKAHRLSFRNSEYSIKPASRITTTAVVITTNLPFTNEAVQTKARTASERALRAEAEHLLPQRLKTLAQKHGYDYKEIRIRKLTSRWGSCSHDKTISLSFYLMQLPWQLIDYVLLHELTHTKHHHHGTAFWAAFEQALPGAKKMRQDIRKHKPRLEPS